MNKKYFDNESKIYIPSEGELDTPKPEKIAYVKYLTLAQMEELLAMGYTIVFNE